MNEFNLDGKPYITLDNLLKHEGLCESGGRAKQMIAAGKVIVDEKVELRKRCKIKATQKVEFDGQVILVV